MVKELFYGIGQNMQQHLNKLKMFTNNTKYHKESNVAGREDCWQLRMPVYERTGTQMAP